MAQNVHRLHIDTYKVFKKKVMAGLPKVPKTELEAGVMIGIRQVLDALEEDIVVNPQGN